MKRLLIALCIVLCMVSSAFCIDPFKVNQGGFGPKIKGLQLGQKMSLLEIVSWGVTQGVLPFTLRFDKEVAIKFEGQGSDFKSFSIEKAEGRYAKLKNFSGTLWGICAEIEKIGFDEREFFRRITLNDDMRIIRLSFIRSDFGAQQMTSQEFAQAFMNAYAIPRLDAIEKNIWQYRDLSQGWQVYVGGAGYSIYSVVVEPIITRSAFD